MWIFWKINGNICPECDKKVTVSIAPIKDNHRLQEKEMAKKRVNDGIKEHILEYLKEKNYRGVTKWEISNMLLTNNIPKFRANPKNVIYILQELRHEGEIVSYRVGRDYYFKLKSSKNYK